MSPGAVTRQRQEPVALFHRRWAIEETKTGKSSMIPPSHWSRSCFRASHGQALPEVEPLLDMQSTSTFCPDFRAQEGFRKVSETKVPDNQSSGMRPSLFFPSLWCPVQGGARRMQGRKQKKPAILTLLLLTPTKLPTQACHRAPYPTRREPDRGNIKQPSRSGPRARSHLTMAQTTPNAGCAARAGSVC